jgi:hypothetical protein
MSHFKNAFVLAISLAVCSCGSTTVLSTWKDPAVTQLSLHKVLVISPNHNPSTRRTAEDTLVSKMPRVQAVASYTILPDADLGNNEEIRTRAKAAGFDGIVVMRLVSVEKQATWVPGAYVGPYYAYGAWPAYDPGYVQVNTYVRIETNVYTLSDDKMVWASASQTVDPSSVHSLVSSTADAVAKEMKKEGLIP